MIDSNAETPIVKTTKIRAGCSYFSTETKSLKLVLSLIHMMPHKCLLITANNLIFSTSLVSKAFISEEKFLKPLKWLQLHTVSIKCGSIKTPQICWLKIMHINLAYN